MPNNADNARRTRSEDALAALTTLHFNPTGLVRVAQVLDRAVLPGSRVASRLEAADYAYFIEGSHRDGTHRAAANGIHPAFNEAREGTGTGEEARRVRTRFRDNLYGLLLDAATSLDRIDSGCTITIRVSGLQQPSARIAGTLPLPQDLRSIHVYAPPHILYEIPTATPALARIVQLFVEEIGVHTVKRFELLAKQQLGWSFPRAENAAGPPFIRQPLIPDSNGTSHYLFRGRPRGELEGMLGQPYDEGGLAGQALRDEIELLQRQCETHEIMQHELDVRVHEKEHEIAQLKTEIDRVMLEFRTREGLCAAHTAEMAKLKETNQKLLAAEAALKQEIIQLKNFRQTNANAHASASGASRASGASTSSGASVSSQSGASIPSSRPLTPSARGGNPPSGGNPPGRSGEHPLRPLYAEGVGPATEAVIVENGLPHLVHNDCEELIRTKVSTSWVKELMRRLSIPKKVADDLRAAMRLDVLGPGPHA